MKKAERDALIAKAENDPLAQVNLARVLISGKYRAVAYKLAVRALEAAPDDADIRRIGRQVLGECSYPGFFKFVRNRVRNEAYEAAIRRAVKPGMRVLEIGTGTGMFAMMAARAGAAVVSCEENVAMADTARETIARNGLSGRVRVIGLNSTRLKAQDIGGRADLLISEVLPNSLRDHLEADITRQAVADLLVPGAPLIPMGVTACVALAQDTDLASVRMGMEAGFDLSAFNRLAPTQYLVRDDGRAVALRSAAAEIIHQDLRPAAGQAAPRGSATLIAEGGRVDGIVQWISLALDAETTCENRPGTDAVLGWEPTFHLFDSPRELVAGTEVTVHARQEAGRLRVWAESA